MLWLSTKRRGLRFAASLSRLRATPRHATLLYRTPPGAMGVASGAAWSLGAFGGVRAEWRLGQGPGWADRPS